MCPQVTRSLFFLRVPISRFVSGFFQSATAGSATLLYPLALRKKIAFDHFHLPNQLALALFDGGLGARESLRRNEKYPPREGFILRWLEHERYFDLSADDILFIGLQENLATDFEALKSKNSFPTNLASLDDDLSSHRTPSDVDRSLQGKAVNDLMASHRHRPL